MHPGWLSNAFLVGDEPGGVCVFVDAGAPVEPLLEAAARASLTPTHVLLTHDDHDHVAELDALLGRVDVPVVHGERVETGGLVVEPLPTPGHADPHHAFVVNEIVCATGDVLFAGSVGGGDFDGIRHSVMDVLMALPPETRLLPGHAEETSVARELEDNPFVRVWAGEDPEGEERCRVGLEEATLVVWSPDYDGKGKAWVRYDDGRDAIVGGSRVERL